MKKCITALTVFCCFLFVGIALAPETTCAQEVDKGGIPAAHLAASCKKLPWGVSVWDVEEAVDNLKSKKNIIWIDTRPESLYNRGTVCGALLQVYGKSGEAGNELTQESLEAAVTKAGITKADATIVFFCQGPKCHRSYNATFAAVNSWGFDPKNIIWFRAGYPDLFTAVKTDPKLKRKAKRYLSAAGVEQL